ncbi:hypothetical protein CKO28_01005 [Rhodovibrio sodomensis]|uniref:Uncharacterized protein n=1 Tax=Rhodovibrio sodomensis TaxID=1088 RepID=A0ABS1D9P9_9PROT|nr:hypothetical protein [Rhodovibrio sodomensis]MBK1666621.1 hypothetical protein [Rhodovibrio sodomensis]
MTELILPIRRIPGIYHVGTLAGHAPSGSSFEGNALSVSLCPETWRQIARLGDAPVWRLDKPDARFLDLTLLRTGERAALVDLAVRHALIIRARVFRVWDTDEAGYPAYMEFADRAEADAEASDDPDDPKTITEEDGLVATANLAKRVGIAGDAPSDMTFDFSVMALAEDWGLDGVTWQEALDPFGLSAPRGAIFQSRVPLFDATRTDPTHLPDDQDLLSTLGDACREAVAAVPAAIIEGAQA